MIERLLDALRERLGDSVSFHAYPPSTMQAPAVVVTPGKEPFLEPGGHGVIREYWDIQVITSMSGPDRGVTQLRELSLAVMHATHAVGAIWDGADGPVKGGSSQAPENYTVTINRIRFKYTATEVEINDESESS